MAGHVKTYRYVEPRDPVNGDFSEVFIDKTEAQIIAENYEWWSRQMRERGKSDLISEQNCIEDYVIVHWAWEVK